MRSAPAKREGDGGPVPDLPVSVVRRAVDRALAEDLGRGDVTTDAFVPADAAAAAGLIAREPGIIAGIDVARGVFERVDARLRFESLARDGDAVAAGESVARVTGSARSILKAERVALNFAQRLSGIATMTARYVAAVEGTGARIVDTRKTTPGLRALEKYAVRCGGGRNHRFDLSDAVLVKDNHRAALRAAGDTLEAAVRCARERLPHTVTVQVEVDSLDQLDEALAAGVDAVLLDNMPPEALREAVRRIDGRALAEASGGITLETVRDVAETGVDLISVGALTHSVAALDIALDFEA